jgi:hypothetical protein
MNKPRRKNNQAKKTQAELADRHELYQLSVQEPEHELELIQEKYLSLRGRKAVSFREDFCGTAKFSVEWCKLAKENTAQGIDLCEETLQWGRQHNLSGADENVASRVELIQGNVLDIHEPKVDVTCALNFSYNIFKTRELLSQYFRSVLTGLNKEGVLIMDVFGGTEAICATKEKRKIEGQKFKFIWEQEKYNPISNEILCHIHFKFKDGSKIKRAFTYDWRLWTIAELKELLLQAGFSKTHVYWEEYIDDVDDDDYMITTGRYIEVEEVENQESWVAYLVAEV